MENSSKFFRDGFSREQIKFKLNTTMENNKNEKLGTGVNENQQEPTEEVSLLREANSTIKRLRKLNYEQSLRLQMFDDIKEMLNLNKNYNNKCFGEISIEDRIDRYLFNEEMGNNKKECVDVKNPLEKPIN